MNDRPDAAELLAAVRRFLETDVVALARGAQKYQARVAANVLAIVEREWALSDRHLAEEWESLGRLLGQDESVRPSGEALGDAIREQNERLVERIRAGDADAGPWRADVLEHLRRVAAAKLEVARGDS